MVDILLHLGVAGAILILALILYAFYRSGKYAITVKTGMAFLPMIGMVFVVMSNISLSMLLELEYFVWVLLLFAILVGYGSRGEKTKIENSK
jgi:tellurite resistance protein TehA-like permease